MLRSMMAPGLALLALLLPQSVHAQKCTQNEIAAIISDMGVKLRRINTDNQAKMRSRLRELAKLKGWGEAETEDQGLDLLEDDETRVQDETASHLLGQVDKLGQTADGAPPCSQIEELKAVAAQLVEVTGAKAAHLSAKLDNELKAARTVVASQTPAPEPKKAQPAAPAVQQPAPAPPVAPKSPPAKPPWETQTKSAVKPTDAYLPPPLSAPAPGQAPPTTAANTSIAEFSVEDIRAAGSGLFGTVSAELAAVIEYMFKSYGRPTGYILGTEGGAALIAGLRYGEGMLVTKADGERRIYWQGPSVGYDLGLTGSRTMILVYNISNPDEILQRFGGVDGSAYLVGGAGVTIMKRGPIILAPIRTGLGLRLGANIGYLKFTSRPRFSPF